MQFYKAYLEQNEIKVNYIDSQHELSDIRKLLPALSEDGIDTLTYRNPTDYFLEQRLKEGARKLGLKIKIS